jgi:phosphate transport system permease protein
MSYAALFLLLAVLVAAAYWLGKYRALALVGGGRGIRRLHSLPGYYGLMAAVWTALPCLLLLLLWAGFQESIIGSVVQRHLAPTAPALDQAHVGLLMNDVRNVVAGTVAAEDASPVVQAAAAEYQRLRAAAERQRAGLLLLTGVAALLLARRAISPQLRARNVVEALGEKALLGCSLLAILVTIGILLSVLYESVRFFGEVPVHDFLFGTSWSPQTAMRADQVGSSGSFGAVPLFLGTMMISGIAMLVAVPVGLYSAVYLAEYAHRRFRSWAKPMLEVLAGIPTVVYGFFAALVVGPALRGLGERFGLDVASESALAAGLVMGVMIVPFVSSLADDMITAVPQSLRDGAYALGATRSETIRQVVLPAALPGIVGGVLLAVSRAIGETMIVVMAAGLAANLTANPLQAVTTVTVQIVTLLTGDQEFDSAKTLAAFALGLVLFVVTLGLNFVALYIVRKYREQYE